MEIYGDIQNSKISHKHAYSYVFIIQGVSGKSDRITFKLRI